MPILHSKNILVQEDIAEFALWIVELKQSLKVWQLLEERLYARGRHGKQLAPMRADIERGKLMFDHGQYVPDPRPVLFPRKVDGNAGLFVAWAHPKVVRRNGSHLRNLKEWNDVLPQLIDGTEGCECVLAWNDVLALQFLATAGCEFHAEMG